MTTAQQRRFYFPKWQDCARANDWVMIKGRLLGSRTSTFASGEARKLYNAVWDAAEILSRQNHRAVTADDLRHACHYVALHPPITNSQFSTLNSQFPQSAIHNPKSQIPEISSTTLTTEQTNRVARLFEILTDPDDLDAMIAWTDPSVDKRKSLVRWINSMAPEAYICELAKIFPAFNWPFWEDLPIDQLRSLARLLKKRVDARAIPISELSPQPSSLTPESSPIDLSQKFVAKPF
jgi:hypothetical protein